MDHRSRSRGRPIAILVALGLVGLLCLDGGAPRHARAGEEPRAQAALEAQVDAYVKPLVDLGLFSGAVLVAKGGTVLVEKAYGEADLEQGIANTPSTRFKLMSVTKAITAVGVMRLVQDGKLGLEDPVARHLPDWPPGWRGVTVHQLLEHTSGIPNLETPWAMAARQGGGRGLPVWRAQAQELGKHALASTPGTKSRYSNFNFVLLGLLVEAASGRPYPEYVKAAVFDKAKMTNAGFDDGTRRTGLSIGYFRGKEGKADVSVQDMSGIRAAGDVFATARDLYCLDRALHGDAILEAKTRETMWTTTPASRSYACGWQVSQVKGHACVRHSGGANGYVANFVRFPADDACVVALSNYAYAPVGRVADDLAAMLFGWDYEPPKAVSAGQLEACVGLYRSTGDERWAAWVRQSGRTLLLFQVRPGVPRCGGNLLTPLAEDRYRQPWGAEAVRFLGASEGRFGRARFSSFLPEFERVPEPVEAWKGALGAYGGTRSAPAVRLSRDERSFRIRDEARGVTLHLVPLSDTLALVLYMESFGTVLHAERDAQGNVQRLRWQRNDGSQVEASRH